MLDTDVERIRIDRLREFVREQRQLAEGRRVDAIREGQRAASDEATGEIEAFEQVLQYLATHADETEHRSLEKIR
ncbi:MULTISPECIES: hypothetical protein [Salinibaculum]|uniref:hypothetical protein n=1 Tax=Salinibaculum TaxID=2732368 RepID=UPI0030D0525B